MTPSVAAPGDTNLSDATGQESKIQLFLKVTLARDNT